MRSHHSQLRYHRLGRKPEQSELDQADHDHLAPDNPESGEPALDHLAPDHLAPDHPAIDHPALGHLALDHVAVAVHDLEAASAPYLLLGLSIDFDEHVGEQGVRIRMLSSGPNRGAGRLELLEPTGGDTPVGRFLARRGPGLHHVGLHVDSLDDEVRRLQDGGARFVEPQPRGGHAGSRVIFLHPEWTGGVLVELVEHRSSRLD